MEKDNILEALDYITASSLNYQEWINVGMALKSEGYPCSVWDDWSAKDAARYKAGECERKWAGSVLPSDVAADQRADSGRQGRQLGGQVPANQRPGRLPFFTTELLI